MTQAFVTISIPFEAGNGAVDRVNQALDALGNPAKSELRDKLRGQVIHFMSMTVVEGPPRPHLVIELVCDGAAGAGIDALAASIGPEITAILPVAGIAQPAALGDFLRRHSVKTGTSYFTAPGLDFPGTPDMTCERILSEARFARYLRDKLAHTDRSRSPLKILRATNVEVFADPDWKWMLQPEPTALLADAPPGFSFAAAVPRALCGVWQFGWPFLVPALLLIAYAACKTWGADGFWHAMLVLAVTVGVALATGVTVVVALLVKLVRMEAADKPDDSMPDPTRLEAVLERENRNEIVQNHLAGVSVMKAGWFRRLTVRLAFWVIGFVTSLSFRPGYLGKIGTIHYARWVLLPGTDKLLFFSNYGGSWESYLEDFITLAHNGLTGVWSNTLGFPRTKLLFTEGAQDGDRFKRWARRQQYPTRFWYSAYPDLSTDRIRTNAAIRHGLATARTEDEAQAWISMFGSRLRTPTLIETEEVQTILFGGLKYHTCAVVLVLRLSEDPAQARAWLRQTLPQITFGDQASVPTVQLVAFTAGGLQRLGVAEELLDTFPLAFRQGMAHPVRTRVLKDTGPDAPDHWLWGSGERMPDVAVFLYARNEADRQAIERDAAAQAQVHGALVLHRVQLQRPAGAPGTENRTGYPAEPFGFADGISQPIMRGTRRWMREFDSLHVVAPGEFILGYPDNRGYLPLTPNGSPAADPGNALTTVAPLHSQGFFADFDLTDPDARRDLGRNGTFVVLRQLEQHVDKFHEFVDAAPSQLMGQPGVPTDLKPDQLKIWLAAKMVGRWPDGTSLVRFPNRPGMGWNGERKDEIAPDNSFLFGAEDPLGERCPFGAHIRRANPRDNADPGSLEQVAIVNRHRILRFGRSYQPGEGGEQTPHPGLLFMCANADIERQFEFIQQTWSMTRQFSALDNEEDPLLTRGGKMGRISIPTNCGPLQVQDIPALVRLRGGGYFFMPGKRTLHWLSAQVFSPLEGTKPRHILAETLA